MKYTIPIFNFLVFQLSWNCLNIFLTGFEILLNIVSVSNLDVSIERTRLFQSDKEATKAIEDHEIQTNTKFSIHAKDVSYGKEGSTFKFWHSHYFDITKYEKYLVKWCFLSLEFELRGHKILFEDIKSDRYLQQISFTGIPFIILGKKRYDCTHGVDRGISTKRKYKEKKQKKVIVFILKL